MANNGSKNVANHHISWVGHKIGPLIGHLIDLIELINYRGQISNFAHNG